MYENVRNNNETNDIAESLVDEFLDDNAIEALVK